MTEPATEFAVHVFEDFRVVTQSVREGVDVRVRVEPEGDASVERG